MTAKYLGALLLALAALFFAPHAQAATGCTQNGSSFTCDTVDHAYQAVASYPFNAAGYQPYCRPGITPMVGQPYMTSGTTTSNTGTWTSYWQCGAPGTPTNNYGGLATASWSYPCPGGKTFDTTTNTCPKDCTVQPNDHVWDGVEGGSNYCQAGCLYVESPILGTGGAPTGANCKDNTPPCGSGYVKLTSGDFMGACAPDRDGDGISDANDPWPDDPSNGRDGAQPPPPPPPNCGQAGQPPCTPPGDQSDDTSSGGGTCDSAPSCSGDGIMCAQLFQEWKGRCAAEKTANALTNSKTGISVDTSALQTNQQATTDAVNGLATKIQGVTDAINNKPVGVGGETSSCGPGDESCAGTAGTGNDAYAGAGDVAGKTVGSIVGDFVTKMKAAPVIHAADNFFTFSGGASCPVFSVPATAYWDTLVFDYHCSGPLHDALVAGGLLLLAIYAYAAFKIAVY